MRILQGKLLMVLEEQRAATVADIRGDMVKAEWGVAPSRPCPHRTAKGQALAATQSATNSGGRAVRVRCVPSR